MHDKVISTVNFIAYINIKFLKCLRTNVCSVEDAETKHYHVFYKNIFQANEKKKKWMPQSKYVMGLFQTITPNVAIEKRKILNNDALLEGAICQDCKLIFCAVVSI